ncbi:hypothetical protein B0H14DRAFT_2532347, partial [Mycena olivaceomarginata]
MAAKALRERLEAETTLEETRKKANETRDGQETSTELRAAHDALAAGAERYVLLKTKYNKVKENKTALRGALTEQDTQIHSLGEKISRIQAEYEAEKKEKAQLQQALRELLETAEGLRNEGKESIDQKKNGGGVSETASLNVSIAHKFIDQKKNRGGASETTKVIAKYTDYMSELPLPEQPPPSPPSVLDPICYKSVKSLHAYLSQNPTSSRFLNRMLYLPRRLVSLSDFSYLAYGPTYRYECATKTWVEGSDLSGFHGRTRELFVQNENFIVYAGTYKCYDLSPLHPKGIDPPPCINKGEIIDTAMGVPRPQDHASLMKQRYPGGKIKVTATGLQCVGFSMELYESLRHRFAICSKKEEGKAGTPSEELRDANKKRKAGSQDLRDGKVQSQKTEKEL